MSGSTEGIALHIYHWKGAVFTSKIQSVNIDSMTRCGKETYSY